MVSFITQNINWYTKTKFAVAFAKSKYCRSNFGSLAASQNEPMQSPLACCCCHCCHLKAGLLATVLKIETLN